MANWNDEITLIAEAQTSDDDTNENGFEKETTETVREVFANKKSVGYSEFYKSMMAGQTAEMKFDVHGDEYHDEKVAIYRGKRYYIMRAYQPEGMDDVELTLSDLPEGGVQGGAIHVSGV